MIRLAKLGIKPARLKYVIHWWSNERGGYDLPRRSRRNSMKRWVFAGNRRVSVIA